MKLKNSISSKEIEKKISLSGQSDYEDDDLNVWRPTKVDGEEEEEYEYDEEESDI